MPRIKENDMSVPSTNAYNFKMGCWRRLLRVPWTTRRSNQWTLKEINPEYSLEGLVLKLKFQYFWPPDAKNWFTRKDPDAGKDWRQKEHRMQRMRWLEGIMNSMDMSLSNLWEIVKDRGSWHATVHRVAKSWIQLSDWATTIFVSVNQLPLSSLSFSH